jgi:hypothetical protein
MQMYIPWPEAELDSWVQYVIGHTDCSGCSLFVCKSKNINLKQKVLPPRAQIKDH